MCGGSAHLGRECSLSSAQCRRLEGGLDKLKEATIQLDELNQKLAEQKIVLAEKSAACEALLEEISTNTAIGECGTSPHTLRDGAPGAIRPCAPRVASLDPSCLVQPLVVAGPPGCPLTCGFITPTSASVIT